MFAVWCRLLCQMSDPVGVDLYNVRSAELNYNLILHRLMRGRAVQPQIPQIQQISFCVKLWTGDLNLGCYSKSVALTQISGGKYSSFLRIWTVFCLPYSNGSEIFATRDA